MKAGREMDVLIAIKVMGWESVEDPDFGSWFKVPEGDPARDPFGSADMPPCYSTEIRDAWMIVEKLYLIVAPLSALDGVWQQLEAGHSWWSGKPGYSNGVGCYSDSGAYGSTAPEAICLAALSIVGVDVEEG